MCGPLGLAVAWALVEVDLNPPASPSSLSTFQRFGTDFLFSFGTLLSVSFPALPGLHSA